MRQDHILLSFRNPDPAYTIRIIFEWRVQFSSAWGSATPRCSVARSEFDMCIPQPLTKGSRFLKTMDRSVEPCGSQASPRKRCFSISADWVVLRGISSTPGPFSGCVKAWRVGPGPKVGFVFPEPTGSWFDFSPPEAIEASLRLPSVPEQGRRESPHEV